MIATIGRNGEVIIPSEVRVAAHLEEGNQFEIEVTEEGVLLRVCVDDLPDPWYYDTPEWEEGLQRSLADLEAGRTTYHDSAEEFLAALDQWSKDAGDAQERAVVSGQIKETGTMDTTTKSDELLAHLRTTTMTARLGSEDGLILPEKIMRAAGLAAGDMLYAEVLDEGEGELRIRLRKIDPDQAWFWTPEWQVKLQEALDDGAAGRTTIHYSDEEFLAALEERSKHANS